MFNVVSGTIKNLTLTGEYKAYQRAGGICYRFKGTMSNCINKVNISQASSFRDLGAFVGYADGKYSLINCINYGNINCNGSKNGGGMIGTDWSGSSASVIYNCINFGNVGSAIQYTTIGSDNKATIANYYNYGECSNFGLASNTYKNCYSLEDKVATINTEIIIEKSEEYMKSQDFIDNLNGYIESNTDEINTKNWCKWVAGSNNLPVLDFSLIWNPTAGEEGTGAFVPVT